MRLMNRGTAKIFKHPKANTFYLDVPAKVASDSQFIFKHKDRIVVSIDSLSRLIIEREGA